MYGGIKKLATSTLQPMILAPQTFTLPLAITPPADTATLRYTANSGNFLRMEALHFLHRYSAEIRLTHCRISSAFEFGQHLLIKFMNGKANSHPCSK